MHTNTASSPCLLVYLLHTWLEHVIAPAVCAQLNVPHCFALASKGDFDSYVNSVGWSLYVRRAIVNAGIWAVHMSGTQHTCHLLVVVVALWFVMLNWPALDVANHGLDGAKSWPVINSVCKACMLQQLCSRF